MSPQRRGDRLGYIVDHEHLADLIMRRCEGCDARKHREVAKQFLSACEFPPEDCNVVLALVDRMIAGQDDAT